MMHTALHPNIAHCNTILEQLSENLIREFFYFFIHIDFLYHMHILILHLIEDMCS